MDELAGCWSVSHYRLFPYRTASLPPPPLFLAPGTPQVDPLPPLGPAPLGVSQVDHAKPVEVAVDSGAARGAGPASAGTGVGEPGVSVSEGAEPGGAEPERVESGGAESGSAELGGAAPELAASGGSPGVPSRREPLSPQQLREWYARGFRGAVDAAGAAGTGGAVGSAGGASGAAGGAAGARVAGGTRCGPGAVGGPAGAGATGPGGARTGTAGAGGAAGVGAAGTGAVATRGVSRGTSAGGAAGVVSGDPGAEGIGAVSAVSGGAAAVLRSAPSADAESDSLRAASPTVTRFLAIAVTDPLSESNAASALIAELVDFAAACCLNFASSLVDEVKRPPGSPHVFKARYVARGFSQRQGVDFFQTFSPTPKMTTLRVLLHVAAQRNYENHWLDFSTAFLQGSLHEEIWLRCPPGVTGSFPADDLVFATADTEALAHVKSELQKRHKCTDLGELTSYLGLRITRDRAQRTITLTQSHMVQQVLQRFGFTYSLPQSTPLSTGHSLSAPPSDESVEPSGPYPELVGCLMYLMTCTRPDLAYPLSLLAWYVAPGRHRKVHRDAAKRVLRYLCSTSSMGLVLGGRARVVLTGHAEASWVDDLATQRSSQGYTFSLGSGSVSWCSAGMGLVLGGRGPVVLTGHTDASWADDSATQRSSQGYTFSLGSGSVSWRSTCSSSVLSSSCEAEIYAGAMAA
ncbi:unnamed protein product [Closterium sp. NIES-54]